MLESLRERLAAVLSWSDEDDAGSVWDLTPSWQYGGLLVEAGGLTRGEQEEAIREVHEQAADMEREARNRER